MKLERGEFSLILLSVEDESLQWILVGRKSMLHHHKSQKVYIKIQNLFTSKA